jgi:hypothetical protein
MKSDKPVGPTLPQAQFSLSQNEMISLPPTHGVAGASALDSADKIDP